MYCKNTETLIDVSREDGLKIYVRETRDMLLSRHQNAGQDLDTDIAKRSFEKCVTILIFRNDSSNQNLIQEDIKRRLNSGNA
jgi:hypothetical protein